MKIKIVRYPDDVKMIDSFFARDAFSDASSRLAEKILSDIRRNGDKAVLKYARQFDGAALKSDDLAVEDGEIRRAERQVSDSFKEAVKLVAARVARFAKAGKMKAWKISTDNGGLLGEKYVPLDRIGVYIPGGRAPLASTALMTAVLARVAGVKEIAACTPADENGKVNDCVLYALKIAGATEIYRVGGVQAIGMMAYGTKTCKKVQKIVGPGGPYVTAAKRLVYGDVALDLVAGPSEIAVLADDAADPECTAADLISQAEHGTGEEKILLVCASMAFAKAVERAFFAQARKNSRFPDICKVIKKGALFVVCKSLEDGIGLCNKFAPEHLELLVRRPRKVLDKITCSGAVFLGKWTPESVGDFVAGPSHVLPTGGSAQMFSGLTVNDFLRRISFVEYTKKDLQDARKAIKVFGEVEGLEGHLSSAEIRFKS